MLYIICSEGVVNHNNLSLDFFCCFCILRKV
nr:MAG TPA: hypothetical protein [Caudoviricetes sp.]